MRLLLSPKAATVKEKQTECAPFVPVCLKIGCHERFALTELLGQKTNIFVIRVERRNPGKMKVQMLILEILEMAVS